MRRTCSVAALTIGVVLTIAGSAHAATVAVNASGELGVFGTGSAAESIVVSGSGGSALVTSINSALVPGPGCLATSFGVQCTGVASLRASLGDGDDQLQDALRDVPGNVTGGNGDDFILAPARAERLIFGGEGDDRIQALGAPGVTTEISGEDGADRIVVERGNSVLTGGDGNDLMLGGSGPDKIRGTTGDDRIDGSDGRDSIFGEDGTDTLIGGKGRDSIKSGAGRDRVRARDGARDKIDCTDRRDRLTIDRKLDTLTQC